MEHELVYYKGRQYRLLWTGQTAFGARAKLQFTDGTHTFFVNLSDTTPAGSFDPGVRTVRGATTKQTSHLSRLLARLECRQSFAGYSGTGADLADHFRDRIAALGGFANLSADEASQMIAEIRAYL